MTTNRATLEELLEFANKVRLAGGGNPLDALLPSVPRDSKVCLIAQNLNFNCQVRADWDIDGATTSPLPWVMQVDSLELATKIGERLGLGVLTRRYQTGSTLQEGGSYYEPVYEQQYAVILPKRIGQCASDFDITWDKYVDSFYDAENAYEAAHPDVCFRDSMGKLKPLPEDFTVTVGPDFDAEMVKMVETSKLETYGNATLVNKDGSIVV